MDSNASLQPIFQLLPSSSSSTGIPEHIKNKAYEIASNLLPEKSKDKYLRAYNIFQEYMKSEQTILCEEALLSYFHILSDKYCPSSMWTTYSMLKNCIMIYNSIDISTYKLLLKKLNKDKTDFHAKKAKVFTPEEVKSFLENAPDSKYLDIKVR